MPRGPEWYGIETIFSGDGGFRDLYAILDLVGNLRDFIAAEGVLRQYADTMLEDIHSRFGVLQEGWPPLDEETNIDRMIKGFNPNEPLLRTGGLRDSWQILEDERDQITIGVAADDPHRVIAEVQEMGNTHVPARPVLLPVIEKYANDFLTDVDRIVRGRMR